MNKCPLTYEKCTHKYSKKGLHLLSPRLNELDDFPYSAQEQRELAVIQAAKISIQGVQPKLSVILSAARRSFEMVEQGGMFILKPPHHFFEELPQNEDLTMRLAQLVDLETPLHGMIYNKDGSLTYFIKRFDRLPKGHKLGVEDFSQLMGLSRDTKYESSMEKLIPVIDTNCTFPLLEKIKLFRLTLFNYLVGNEDAHLKNFSLIRKNNKVEISPLYDLVNSTIVLRATEELALPLKGKKSRFNREDFFEYFGKERLGLNEKILNEESERFRVVGPLWTAMITNSFLSEKMRSKYIDLVEERRSRLL